MDSIGVVDHEQPKEVINPRCACTARVTVVILSVCLCVCVSVCLCLFSNYRLRDGL